MEPHSQNFFQIFFHSSHAALHRAPDNALVNALLPGDLAVAFAENQMRLYPDALHLWQRVEGIPQVDEQLHTIQKLLRGRLMQAGRVFDPIVTVEGIPVSYTHLLEQANGGTIILAVIILAVFISFSGYLLIYNIFYISVIKDVQFYGCLKTIGTTKKQIKRIIYKQALKISYIGIPIGLLLGAVVSFGVVPYFLNMMYSTNSDVGIKVSFSPLIFMGAAIFTFITVIDVYKRQHITQGDGSIQICAGGK